jgi:hypothetical protein
MTMRSLQVCPESRSSDEGVRQRWKLMPQPAPLSNGGASSTIR